MSKHSPVNSKHRIGNRGNTEGWRLLGLCARACRFAHLGRHLPSQSISHTHYSDNKENSKKLRTSVLMVDTGF